MLIYDNIYRLRGKPDAPSLLAGKMAYAWRLRIMDFSRLQPEIRWLKPCALVATRTGEGIFRSGCAQAAGKSILAQFGLTPDRVLWIEHDPESELPMQVARFIPDEDSRKPIYYEIDLRPIRPNELRIISPFVPEARALFDSLEPSGCS